MRRNATALSVQSFDGPGGARVPSGRLLLLALALLATTLTLGLSLAQAAPGDAPEVTTPTAEDIAVTKATFSGEVNPNGLETTYLFEYRAVGAPDWNATTDDGAGDGLEPRGAQLQVEGLEPDTEYEFRLVATNSTGTTTSGTETFQTLPAVAPDVTIPTAENVEVVKATLLGEVDPNGLETTYRFEYRAVGAPDWIATPDEGAGEGIDPNGVQQQAEGLDPETEYEARLVASNSVGTTTSGTETFQTLPAVPPSITTLAVSEITRTSALFVAVFNPNGLRTDYRFEFRIAGDADWIIAEENDRDGLEDEEVDSDTVEGLDPGTEYEVRFVATNDAGTTTSGVENFETLPTLQPSVTTPILTDVTADAARFMGRVSTNGADTTYRFEYQEVGDPDWIGVPDPEEFIEDRVLPAVVDYQVSGLEADTEYRVRLSATNEIDSTTSAAQEFTTRSGLPVAAPPKRPYEMISPLETGGGDVDGTPLDDDHVLFLSQASFLEDDVGLGIRGRYLLTRSENGWVPTSNLLGAGAVPNDNGTFVIDYSDDLSQQIIEGPSPLLPADQDLKWDIYTRDVDTGELALASIGSIDDGNVHVNYSGRSADASHVLFTTNYQGGSPEVLMPEDAGRTSGAGLYERVDGETRVVGLDSDEQLISEAGAVLGAGLSGVNEPVVKGSSNAVSADGSRIFFTSPDPLATETPMDPQVQLYARIDGEETIHVSASQRTLPGNGPRRAVFQGATDDGSIVFFTTTEQLLDSDTDENNDLYRYELESGGYTRLSNAGGDAREVDVQGLMGYSDDGSRIYFVGWQEDESTGTTQQSIYLYDDRDASTKFIVAFSTNAGLGEILNSGLNSPSEAQITPDGGTLVFPIPQRVTSFDNAGFNELYRFQLATGEIVCVSCNPTDQPPLGDVNGKVSFGSTLGVHPATTNWPVRIATDDGSVIAFDTLDALVPKDSNKRHDVYEWRDGRVSLVTAGTGLGDAEFRGISADGSDIFFNAYDRLVPRDTDSHQDLYDARIGGGFPEPASPPACEGDACLPPPVVPDDPTPSSSAYAGPGNLPAKSQKGNKKCAKGKVRRKGKCAKVKSGKSRANNNRGGSK